MSDEIKSLKKRVESLENFIDAYLDNESEKQSLEKRLERIEYRLSLKV